MFVYNLNVSHKKFIQMADIFNEKIHSKFALKIDNFFSSRTYIPPDK